MDHRDMAAIYAAGRRAVIRISDLGFIYRNSETASLRGIDLKVGKGEFIVLTGPSGCGKTTLTRVLNRLCPEYYEGEISGTYTIDGKDMMQSSVYEASLQIGSVFQDPRTQFFTKDTISEVAFGCENRGLNRGEIIRRTDRSFCELDLENLKGRNLLELSSGEKQFIAIASVYCTNPEILIFDEPSANLDSTAIEKLRKLLQQLKLEGKTIIVSEHRLYYLKDLADRVHLMKKGRIIKEFSADEIAHIGAAEWAEHGLRRLSRVDVYAKDMSKDTGQSGLKIDNLCFQYRKKQVLFDGACLFFPRGKVTGIIGENGCGKTTLLELICGLKKASRGTFSLDGKIMNAKSRTEEFYYVMQDVDYQMFTESVLTELLLNSEKAADKEKAEKLLQQFNMNEYRDRHPAALSGGQKQRLSIAVACMKNSEVICLDEPTSGLDYQNMVNISNVIRSLADENKTVIVVSHDDELLENVSDCIIKVNAGRVSCK